MLDPEMFKKSDTKFSELPRKEKFRETIKGVLGGVAVVASVGMIITLSSMLNECAHFASAMQ
jgi:hypothetical protein